MNKLVVAIAGVALLLLCCSVDTTIGVKCYHCEYEELNGEMVGGTATCKDEANLSDHDYLVECSDVEVKTSTLDNSSASLGLAKFEQRSSNRETIWGCYTFRASGKVTGVDGNYAGVLRGCLGTEYAIPENCQEKTMKGWRAGNDEMSKVITEMWSPQSDESLVNACYCREDKCNRPAVTGAAGSVDFPSLSIAFAVGFAVLAQYSFY